MNRSAQQSIELLSNGKACVWLATPDDVTQSELLARYEMLLDDEERKRFQAFHFDDDRHLYLVAHALLRTSLSRYADVPPQAWEFFSDDLGRPEIASGPHGDRIRFNLSHTRGLAACVIARDVDIGIDVECLDRQVDAESIAPRYFSRFEARQLADLTSGERDSRFLEYWTLKEAYVKARGGGLSIPLDSFYFQRDDNGIWRIAFIDSNDDPHAWQFMCVRPTPNHVMSVALHRPCHPEFQLEISNSVPLISGE